MDQLEQITSIIGLSMGVAWASGINLYAAILMLGVLAGNGYIELPPDLLDFPFRDEESEKFLK